MQIRLIKGDDLSVVAQKVSDTVGELVGDGDRSLMVEELTEAQYTADGDAEIVPLVNAAHSPPFLTERRVVVGRNLGMFTKADQVAPLVKWLENPLPSTDLVLVWEKASTSNRLGAVPKSLNEALKAAGGEVIDVSVARKKNLVAERLADSPLRFDNATARMIADHLGDEVGRVQPLVETLISTFGSGATISVEEVEPYLGEASDVPPWELTDAIDAGDISTALDRLHRMTGGGDRHPLQILATLHGHYQRTLALDGAQVGSDREAADLLGMKGSTFPAKKALTVTRKLGAERVREIMLLLAAADLQVRGASAAPPETIMDVLVARLARISH